ncbi:hypothetical protein CL621_00575 [archaeon]|nr:hypothetical protein [archaeon]|tara:strand:- start:1968 stop:3122 length:1155 start_codon:yes stop_codon:yes gene_type:complete
MDKKILFITLLYATFLVIILTLPLPYITTNFITGSTTQSSLVAKISVSANAVEEGKTLYFDGSGSSGNIQEYSWDFDASDEEDEDKKGVTASKAYKIPGVYLVTLSVTDDTGNKKTDTITITVVSVTKKVNIVNGPTAKILSSSSVDITWETDENVNATIYYGLIYPNEIISDPIFSKEKQIILEGLQPNKKYFYYLKLIDKFDNIKTSSVDTFSTAPLKPVVVATTSTTTTTTIPKPTCSDGIQNQGEQEIDCGGPCNRCKIDFPWFTIIISVLVVILVVAFFFLRNYFGKKNVFNKEEKPITKEKGMKSSQITKEKKSSINMPTRKSKISKKPQVKKISPELINYIRNCLSQGFKERHIKKELLKAGWPREQVDDALKSMKV